MHYLFEYYTLYEDIEESLKRHEEQLKDKIIYCNCDNPRYSNFWKYFHTNFSRLQLRGLLCSYLDFNGSEFWRYYGGDDSDISKAEIEYAFSDGSFDNPETDDLLNECDIIITNPPFSLTVEYIKRLMSSGKQFYVMNKINNITHAQIFEYVLREKLWFEQPIKSHTWFNTPDSDEPIDLGLIVWFTNMDCEHLHKEYTSGLSVETHQYVKYDNYDALNVDSINEVPDGYNEEMGVPINFLGYLNPNQFEIVGCLGAGGIYNKCNATIDGKNIYKRLLIKRK